MAVFTDQHLLEQVIYNLVLNAIDASSKGASLELFIETEPERFKLYILDQGCGMPFVPDPSAMSALTTKRFGTGIGIPFAFKVCDALDSKLNYEANPEGGTIITITLPITLNLSVK